MEDKKMWQVLGIAPIKDKDKIKEAYRKQLMKTNPEDDQEGFKLLRQSYEEAIMWAEKDEAEEKEDTPVNRWISQIENNYGRLSARCSSKIWHDLLEQEVCQALDSSNEACEALLVFLMNHCYLPESIWKMIDQVFCITALKESLYEKFPKDFIDYVMRQINGDGFIDMSLFEGPDEGEYDDYIREYFELKHLVDQKKVEQAKQQIEKIEKLSISHPLLTVEKMRLALCEDQPLKAEEIADTLKGPYEDQPYIDFFIGIVKWENDKIEEAGRIWAAILKAYPNYDWASFEMIKYELKTGAYKEAKERCLALLDRMGSREELIDLLKEVNDKLLEIYEKEWQEKGTRSEKENEALRFEMGWCYFQNKRFEECEKLMNYEPSPDSSYEYNNLKGRNYLAMNRFKDALPYLSAWLEEICTLHDDGTERTRNRLQRKCYAYYTVGICYENLGDNIKAAKYFSDGCEAGGEDVAACKERLADFCLKSKKYERCIDLCNEMLEEDDQCYPAYLHRLEAYYQLGDGQNVINDFYNCIKLFPGYYKPYMLAMKVFIAHDQVEDALDIYNKAEENQLENLSLKFYKCQCDRLMAETRQQVEKVISELEQVKQAAETEKGSIEDISEVSCELAVCYIRLREDEKADKCIEMAVKEGGERPRYLWIKADLLVRFYKYEEALALYDRLVEFYPNNPTVYFDRGVNLERLKRPKQAVKDFEKVIELDPSHPDAYGRLSEIYLQRYSDNEDHSDHDKAAEYMDRQLENNVNAYYYVSQGLIYLEDYELKEAIDAFQKAKEEDPKDLFAYNNTGYVYKIMEKYEDAIEEYEKAIDCMENRESFLPYYNMAVCQLILGNYEEALRMIEKDLELFPDSMKCRHLLEEIMGRQQYYDRQIKLYREDIQKNPDEKAEVFRKIGEAYSSKGWHLAASYYYKQSIQEDLEDPEGCISYGYYLLADARRYSKARDYLLEAMSKVKENTYSHKNCCMYLCRTYGRLNDITSAKFYFDKALASIKAQYGSVENYLSFPGYAPARYYDMGLMYIAINEKDKAAACFKKMMTLRKCRNCHYKACFEALIGNGIISELEGRTEEAYMYYKQALQEAPNEGIPKYRIKILEKQLKGGH